jgi:hypothetical protein
MGAPALQARSGFYVGGSGKFKRQTADIAFENEILQAVAGNEKLKTTKNRFGADIFAGYQYSCVVSVAGQVHVGYGGQDIKLSKEWTEKLEKFEGAEAKIHSDVVVKNLVNFGAEALVGANFGTVIGTFVYGIVGVQLECVKLAGSARATRDENTYTAMNFGKEAITVGKSKLAGVQQTTKFVPTATVGLGTRICFLNRFFAGLEGRYHFKASPKIDAKNTSDLVELGVSTPSLTPQKVTLKLNHFSVGATVGVFF